MTAPSPFSHRCDVPTIDYSMAEHGRIVCALHLGGCGRVWTGSSRGWTPDPRPIGQRR
jgi:hypothetical protein